jgi:hypothetical protein
MRLSLCLLAAFAASLAFAFDGERLTARDAGLYVGTASNYMYGKTPLAFTIEQVSKGTSPDELCKRVKRLDANGKRVILDFFLFDKSDEQAKPAADYMAFLDGFLSKLPIGRIYAITLSEENIYWNGHAEMLSALYDLVKAKYPGLAVYQWYSPGASAPGFGWPLLPADGWVIDEYCMPKEPFESLVKKYTILGTPLIHIAWAAPGWKEFATWDKVWADQLAICRRYGVPISFFCWWPKDSTPPPPGGKDMWSWAAPEGTEHYRVWHQMALPYVQRLRRGIHDAQGSDHSIGRPIPIAGDEKGLYAYHDDFHTSPRFIEDASIDGFHDLRWYGKRLMVSAQRTATLTYRFESPFTLHDIHAAVYGDAPDTSITLSLSADGKTWTSESNVDANAEVSLKEPAGAGLRRFLVRVELSGMQKWPADIGDLSVAARVDEPAAPQVTLTPAKDGAVSFTDDFRSQLYLHSGRVTNASGVKWQSGSLLMYGKQGGANETAIDYHFVCDRPVRDIAVNLQCAADAANYGSSVALSTSLDGQVFSDSVATNTSGKDPFRGELTTSLQPDKAGIRDFWLRMKLANTCGVATTTASPVVNRLTVTGKLAVP